ncbi:MAG: DUF3426 domain-containing protein, partial [Alphaproteobacteria bacterium]
RRVRLPGAVALGWGALCLALFALGFGAISQRVAVVRALPGTAPLYRMLGYEVNVRGLEFRDVAYNWENNLGRLELEVHGDIVNITDTPKKVPRLVFGLRDEKGVEVYQWAEEVIKEPLPPGKGATFAARIPSPPKSIKSVQVRFERERR